MSSQHTLDELVIGLESKKRLLNYLRMFKKPIRRDPNIDQLNFKFC